MLTDCGDYEADDLIGKPVSVDLAFAFSSSPAGSQTRQDNGVVQNTSPNVVIQHIIPMIDERPQEEGVSKQEDLLKPEAKAHYFYYGNCKMNQGVNQCLVYAKNQITSDDATDYTKYGTLKEPTPWPTASLDAITFEPVSIYSSEDVPTAANNLAIKLTAIVDADAKWKISEIPIMMNLFQNFTNHGYNLPGSAASVRQWIQALRTAANDIRTNHAEQIGNEGLEILDNVIDKIDTEGTINGDYPRDIHLPDGAAALRWVASEGKFESQLQTTTLDNINSVSRFAYPAPIYYFIKSPISTSNSLVKFNDYKEKNLWSKVLSDHFGADTKVTGATKTVALTNPVDYAVAQLKVTIKASGRTIKDDMGTDITIGATSFPLKGVIVCGQRPVDYQFTQASNSNANVKFIYDSQVKENCNLSTSPQNACNTLVLQSYNNEDVNIILEFENNSDNLTFKCVDGSVYPHTRFYLIGIVKAKSGTGGDGKNNNRVFTKDYITQVDMTVTSLAKAYNVLPNLLTSNLEIGVQTTPDWIEATPTSMRLD